MRRWVVVALSFIPIAANVAGGMSAQEVPARAAAERNTAAIRPSVDPPEGFVIGPEDVLSIVFWRDKEMSTRVTVRPDGRISLPLLDDVQAAGLTAEQLRGRLIEESKRFFANPAVTVAVAAQRVPETFVRSTVTTRSADRLQSITHQILSRTELERIIRDFDITTAGSTGLPHPGSCRAFASVYDLSC